MSWKPGPAGRWLRHGSLWICKSETTSAAATSATGSQTPEQRRSNMLTHQAKKAGVLHCPGPLEIEQALHVNSAARLGIRGVAQGKRSLRSQTLKCSPQRFQKVGLFIQPILPSAPAQTLAGVRCSVWCACQACRPRQFHGCPVTVAFRLLVCYSGAGAKPVPHILSGAAPQPRCHVVNKRLRRAWQEACPRLFFPWSALPKSVIRSICDEDRRRRGSGRLS